MPAPTSADEKAQLACTLASLILADEAIKPTGDKISQILSAANVTVPGYWPGLFVKAFSGQNVSNVIFTAPLASGTAAPAAAAAAASSSSAAAEEAPKEEKKKEESEADVGAGGLFGEDAGADY